MNSLPRLTITAPDGTGATASVLVNGEPARNVTGVSVHLEAGGWTRAEIRLGPVDVEFDGTAAVSLDDETRELLHLLGWTAPAPLEPAQ